MGSSPTTDTSFRRIYDEHFEAVTRYCLRRLPVAEVNDATAEVFLVAWRQIDRVPEGPAIASRLTRRMFDCQGF